MNLVIRIVRILFSSKSDDETQGISPSQKLAFVDEGVPPPMKRPNSFSSLVSQSSSKSNLKVGTNQI